MSVTHTLTLAYLLTAFALALAHAGETVELPVKAAVKVYAVLVSALAALPAAHLVNTAGGALWQTFLVFMGWGVAQASVSVLRGLPCAAFVERAPPPSRPG